MKPILHIFFLSCFINVYSQQNDYELEFQNRAFLLLNYVSEEYSYNAPGRNNDNLKVPDPEKYNWPAVIARFIINGQDDSIANKRIELFKNNSPFHFTLIGMARIMSQFQESPSLKKK